MKNKSKHRFYRGKHRFTIDNFIYTLFLYKSDCWESLYLFLYNNVTKYLKNEKHTTEIIR